MRELNIPRYQAVGILESLWHFTALYARRGDVGRIGINQLSDWIGWPHNKAGVLLNALLTCGWLDQHPDQSIGYVVHDWPDHADEATKKALKRAHEDFIVQTNSGHIENVSRHVETKSDMERPPEPEPKPEPLRVSNETLLPLIAAAEAPEPEQKHQKQPRAPNPVWDTVVDIWFKDGVATSLRPKIGKIVRDFKDLGAEPDEIRKRYDNYRARWPDMACTPEGLVKHWSQFGAGAGVAGQTQQTSGNYSKTSGSIRRRSGEYYEDPTTDLPITTYGP